MKSKLLLSIIILIIISTLIVFAGSRIMPESNDVAEIIIESEQRPSAPGKVYSNINYGKLFQPKAELDLYEPLLPYIYGEAPLVVFFHGGSWIHGDKITIRIIDRFLNRMRENGYFVASVNYCSTIFSGLSGPVNNGIASVRWLIQHDADFGFDGANIGLYGVSAGGHIALMTEPEFRDLQCISFVFAECAPTDLNAMSEGEAFSASTILGKFPTQYLYKFSPINYTGADMAPVLIFHGDADEIVHVNQAYRLNDAITDAGGHAEIEIYKNGSHAFLGMPDDLWYEQETRALEFMEKFF